MEKEIIVRSSVILHADLPRVWEALTKPEKTRQYMFNCEVTSDWQPGSPITWQGNFEGYEAYQKGIVLKCDPGKFVQYTTFDPNFGLEDLPQNYIHVSYELFEQDGNTRLEVTSENFGGDESRAAHTAAAWDNMVLPKLKALVEGN